VHNLIKRNKSGLLANSSGGGVPEDSKELDDALFDPLLSQDPRLEDMGFRHPLRRYQEDILELLDRKLASGERRFHVVAPPGAGKTIIGLQMVSRFKCPSLILSPNTTIQAQWGQKLNQFMPPGMESLAGMDILGTHEDKPLKPVTLLTYQVLSTPEREQDYFHKLSHQAWVAELTRGRSLSVGEAELRILEILHNNPKAYKREISRHVSRLRKQLSEVLDLKEVLHKNAVDLLQSMRRQQFGLVIFDECHHLTDYWAAIMTHLVKQLGNPLVIGLTGTPPEGKTVSQERRYLSLVGDIDYQVPTPALVREGGLAPFQDLVHFTEPTESEFKFLKEQHQDFHQLVRELTTRPEPGQKDPVYLIADSLAARVLAEQRQDGADSNAQDVSNTLPQVSNIAHQVSKSDLLNAAHLARGEHGGSIAYFDESDEISLIDSFESEVGEQDVPSQRRQTFDSPLVSYLEKAKSRSESMRKIDCVLGIEPPKAPMESTSLSNTPLESILTRWIQQRIDQALSYIPDDPLLGWRKFSQDNAFLADAINRYMFQEKQTWKFTSEQAEQYQRPLVLENWMLLLEDFASHRLKLSSSPDDHILYARIQSAARKLGFAITEQGLRKQASPVDRVLAFSNSKPEAVCKILEVEYRSLEDRLRAAVVTDFERMSATSARTLKNILTDESGGAIAVLRTLLAKPIGSLINPCLVTGSLLLIDKRVTKEFVEACTQFLRDAGHKFDLIVKDEDNLPYNAISAATTQWESRLYVGMATAIFERGITKCLIGTRGLFGEGWDSQALNTLVDLTNTTSPVSVKQLRGRSIRIQTNDPLGARKVANNWDVVCIAPSLEKGLNDYHRFVRKHEGFFGICEDGQIECGVGHVHPSLSSLSGVEVFASSEDFNNEMTDRALVREGIYDLWKVGQPYKNQLLGCVELNRLRKLALTPPHLKRNIRLKEHAGQLRSSLHGVWYDYGIVGGVASIGTAIATAWLAGFTSFLPLILALIPLVFAFVLGKRKYSLLFSSLQKEICRPNTQQSSLQDIGYAVLVSLQEAKVLPEGFGKRNICCDIRNDGSYRVILRDVSSEHSKIFTNSLKEVLAPITSQPYVIPKFEYFIDGENELAQEKEKKFFRSYLRGRAEPRVACYHALPSVLARSQKNRDIFEKCWNKYVSPGFVLDTEIEPQILNRYFGLGPSLAQRLLWE
jgi:superfamily II DNA or RNA helicase